MSDLRPTDHDVPTLARGGTSITPMSVAGIVATAVDRVADPWRLSLVQRDLVWTDTQVRYLLDSLLFGYPIGSLLLCRVSHDGAVLERHGDVRVARSAGEDDWQLLDGQQRVTALVRLFTPAPPDEVRQARFVVSLAAERTADDVVQRRSEVDRSLRYVRAVTPADELAPRWQWLDVSGAHRVLGALASQGPDALADEVATDDAALALAGRIDPLCARSAWAAADEATRARAADRVRRLARAYVTPGVPVVRLSLESPLDVLQVFTRVNRTGVEVAGDDVFFAAVKTLWRDAEEHLHRLQVAVPFLSRTSALRVASRCASVMLGEADLVPLDVEKLNGERGRVLIRKIEELTKEGSGFLERATRVGEAAVRRSGLGFALRRLPQQLIDPVIIWAAGRDALDDAALAPAWAFVLGAAAFGYRTTFGPSFERRAFGIAHAAGAAGQPFPLAEIAARVRAKWLGLTRSRRVVRHVAADDDKRELVNDNTTVFLLVAQQIPFSLPDGMSLDWEHLFPTARGDTDLRWKGPDGSKRLQRHRDSWCISRAGNLMALDASLNRSAGMDWPDEKLRQYREAAHWPPDLFLSPSEEKLVVEACAVLREKRVADGAARLHQYVRERELRIFAAVVDRFPSMLELANRPVSEGDGSESG